MSEQAGIFETMLDEIRALKRIVVDLQSNAGDGIGRVMSVDEAAEWLGITVNGLRQRVRDNRIPYVKNVNGKIVFCEKYLKLSELAPDQATIDRLTEEMGREFGRRNGRK